MASQPSKLIITLKREETLSLEEIRLLCIDRFGQFLTECDLGEERLILSLSYTPKQATIDTKLEGLLINVRRLNPKLSLADLARLDTINGLLMERINGPSVAVMIPKTRKVEVVKMGNPVTKRVKRVPIEEDEEFEDN